MNENSSIDLLTFDGPARYQIRVLGRISEPWLDRLEGMSVNVETPAESPVVCALEGELLDQAALLGILNCLYELHRPVLSVICLSFPPEKQAYDWKGTRNSSL